MKSTFFVLLLSLAFNSAAIGHAEVVSFQIEAEVQTVYDPNDFLDGSIFANDILTGVLQYDTTLPDGDTDLDYGNYQTTALGDNFIKGTNGGFGNFDTTDFFGAQVIDEAGGTSDEVHFFATGDTTPSLISLGVDYVDIDIAMIGTNDMVISNDGLPSTLDLNSFSSAVVYFSSESSNNMGGWTVHFEVAANITSITKVVPEPSSLALLMAVGGILGAGGCRTRC